MTSASETLVRPHFDQWRLPVPGRAGILFLILTETALFSIFVGAYVFYVGKSLTGPSPREILHVPVIGTICLLSSSITIALAVRALRSRSIAAFSLWWLLTVLLAVEFMAGTGIEWWRLIYRENFTIRTNLFGTTYYSLVGLHATHVIVGLVLLISVLIFTIFGRVDRTQSERTELLSWYWHFVDAVWVVVFLTVYVVGR